jgi:hypothetical protein
MNAKGLAMRDYARAALMGALSSDFGQEGRSMGNCHGNSFGDGSFGNPFGNGSSFGADYGFGWNDPHGDFGDDYGMGEMGWNDPHGSQPGFGAAVAPPSQAALMQAWKAHHATRANAARRERLLYPNKNSHVKIEGYEFALTSALVIGTPSPVFAQDRPQVDIRAERVTMNAPSPGFVTFTQLQVGNVNTLVGGTSDAFFYAATSFGQGVSYPTLSPAVPATFAGDYTGLIPPGFPLALAFKFIVEFKGPASMTA